MSKFPTAIFVASILGLGACSTAGGTPATAPPITDPPSPPTTPTPSIATVSTATIIDRLAEIEAIFQELEVQRLQAIMDNDEEAFRAVFANEEYAERSVGGMDLVTVVDPSAAVFTVHQVFVDDSTCVAVNGMDDGSNAIEGASIGMSADHVMELTPDGWGISWVGEGWRCDGPHPFSG